MTALIGFGLILLGAVLGAGVALYVIGSLIRQAIGRGLGF